MYNKNNQMKNVLITFEEVVFHAPTKHNVDPRMIETNIIVAEERFIRPELGDGLYQEMCDSKNIVITAGNIADYQALINPPNTLAEGDIVNAFELLSADYLKFWKEHLWKLVAECVMVCAYPEGFVQYGSEGAFHNSPPAGLMVTSGQVTPLVSSMKWSLDKKVQDRVSPLINSMHTFLCTNKGKYPKYTRACPQDCNTEDKITKNAGIALDIYDQEVDDCCNDNGWL